MENTCFKNAENPSCIDLFLTNFYRSFQNTTRVTTGLSEFRRDLKAGLLGMTNYFEFQTIYLRVLDKHAPMK